MAEDTHTTEHLQAPRKKSGVGRTLIVVLAIIAVALILLQPRMPRLPAIGTSSPAPQQADFRGLPPHPAPEQPRYAEEISRLESRIGQLEARLKTYEELITAMPRSEPQQHAVYEAGQPASQEAQERIAQLEQAVSALQAQQQGEHAGGHNQVVAMVAFGQMKEAAQRGDVFVRQFEALDKLIAFNPEAKSRMAELAPFAEQAVTPPAAALEGFGALAPKALAAGTSGSLKGNLMSLVSIRKTGDQQGNSDEAILARAETQLARGNIDNTLMEMAQLSPKAADVFAGWVKSLQDTQKLHRQLNALEQALAQPPQPPQPPAASSPATE